MKAKWEVVEDGYHRRLRYVEAGTGKILGHVSGSNYESDCEWDASNTTTNPYIGRYVTEGQAKKAVEDSIASLVVKGAPHE